MAIKLIHLSIKNFCAISHGDINFEKYDFCQIKGKKNTDSGDNNGAAKSSVPEAITWCLYGKTGKGIGKDEIIREGRSKCNVVVVLAIDGICYTIIRKRKRGLSESISFRKVNDGITTDLASKGLTQDKIIEVLGMDFWSYIASVYFTQDSMSTFCSGTNAEITKIIQGIIPQTKNIDEFQKMISENYKKLNNEYLAFESEKNALDKMVADVDIYAMEKEKNKVNNEVNAYADKVQRITILLNSIENKLKIIDEINKLKSNYRNLKAEYLSRKDEYGKYIQNCDEKLVKIKSEKQINIKELEDINTFAEIIKKIDKDIVIWQKELSILRDEAASINSKIRGIKRHLKIDNFKNAKYQSVRCSICFMKLDEEGFDRLVKYGMENEKSLRGITIKIEKIENDIDNSIKIQNKRKEEVVGFKNQMFIYEEKQKNYKSNVEQTENERKEFVVKIEELRRHFKVNKKLIKHELILKKKHLDKYKDVNESQYDKISEENEKNNHRIDILQKAYIELVTKIKFYEKNREEYQKINDNYKRITKELRVCEYWQTNIPKLKVFLTSAILPDLNDGIKKGLDILQYNFNVIYKVGKERKSGKISDEFDIDVINTTTGFKRGWKNLSGSEKQRIALVTFFALNNISKFNFVFLDEVLKGFDGVGRRLAMQLLSDIAKKKKIFIIDHLDDIEDYFNQTILIRNNNEVAEVKA